MGIITPCIMHTKTWVCIIYGVYCTQQNTGKCILVRGERFIRSEEKLEYKVNVFWYETISLLETYTYKRNPAKHI